MLSVDFLAVTSLVGYFQCSPAPPPVLDLFPKECANALDCFPNLCCQEGGRRVCRPPRQSILSLFVGVTRVCIFIIICYTPLRKIKKNVTPVLC